MKKFNLLVMLSMLVFTTPSFAVMFAVGGGRSCSMCSEEVDYKRISVTVDDEKLDEANSPENSKLTVQEKVQRFCDSMVGEDVDQMSDQLLAEISALCKFN